MTDPQQVKYADQRGPGMGAVVNSLHQVRDAADRLEKTADRHAKSLFRLTLVIAVFTFVMVVTACIMVYREFV